MAVVTIKSRPSFTGHIGRVRFEAGRAETDRKRELAHFRKHPDDFTVEDDDTKGD